MLLVDVMLVRELNFVKSFSPRPNPKVTRPGPLFIPVLLFQQYRIFSHVVSEARIEFPYFAPRSKRPVYDATHLGQSQSSDIADPRALAPIPMPEPIIEPTAPACITKSASTIIGWTGFSIASVAARSTV